jgi:hypothetical protein
MRVEGPRATFGPKTEALFEVWQALAQDHLREGAHPFACTTSFYTLHRVGPRGGWSVCAVQGATPWRCLKRVFRPCSMQAHATGTARPRGRHRGYTVDSFT